MRVFIDTNIFLDYIQMRDIGVKEATAIFYIVPVGEAAVDKALKLEANDFEDALQYFSAEQADADCIVTRNAQDFNFATEVEIISPKDFLNKYFPNKPFYN